MLRSDRPRDEGAGLDRDVMRAGVSRTFVVVGYAGRDFRGYVLNQRSAKRDVEDLDAATNGKHRHAAGLCFIDECSFGRIARDVDGAYLPVALFAVASGVNVLAAGKNETGNRVEDR